MSAEAEAHVLRICKAEEWEHLRPIHCHVLQLLAIRHNHDYHVAWPSVLAMSRESHYSERALFKALNELTEMQIISRDFGELPRIDRNTPLKSGNRYRFAGLDDIPPDASARLIGGRPRHGDERGASPVDERGADARGSSPALPEMPEMNGVQMNVVQMNGGDEPDAHVTLSTKRNSVNRLTKVSPASKSKSDSIDVKADVSEVFAYFKEKVLPTARVCPDSKIATRLKTWSIDDLRLGIDHFAADWWWMENNSARGAKWFFDSDSRIEQFVNMKPRLNGHSSPSTTRPTVSQRELDDISF